LRQARKTVHETTFPKNNQSKMYWKCGSSGKAPALQMRNPGLNPQIHQKKKKKEASKNKRQIRRNSRDK
jgi:hypothetical protein